MKQIPAATLDNAMDYAAYRSMISEGLASGKTTGENQGEAMLKYTKMNETRMNRLDKTTKLVEEVERELQAIQQPLTWLALTEAWCGDAAQVLPVVNKMAQASEHLSFKLILRDEHPDIMNAFLTNGGKSIPKIIVLDAQTRKVLGSWGPRPAEVQQMVMETKEELASMTDKAAKQQRYQALVTKAQKWYARDKTRRIQQEFLQAVRQSLNAEVTTL